MIELRNINKKYSDGTDILNNVNLTLPDKGLVFLKGRSGSGKTSLLNLLSGLSKPSSGEIIYNGKNISNYRDYFKKEISYFTQDYNLISFLNVEDNIFFNNFKRKKDSNDIIKKLGIDGILKNSILSISGGEAKRVQLAKCLCKESNVILCDEPLNSLDRTSSIHVMDLLKDISKSKLVIITGHNVQIISKYADRIVEIKNGIVTSDIKHKLKVKDSKNLIIKNNNILKMFTRKMFKNDLKKNIVSMLLLFILCGLFFFFLNTIIDDTSLIANSLIENKINRTYVYGDFVNNLQKAKSINTSKRDFSIAKVYYNQGVPLRIYNYYNNQPLYYGALNDDLKFSIVNEFTFTDSDVIIGNIPTNGDEILITEYFFYCLDYLENIGDNIESVIGKKIKIGDYYFKIVGVLKQNLKDFEFLKDVYNLESSEQNILYNFFDSGILSKDVIYVSKQFENYITYDNYEILFLIYNTNNIREMLMIKNKFANDNFITDDYYTEYVKEFDEIINAVKNISLVAVVIIFIIIIFVLINYVNNIFSQYKKDLFSLYYDGYNRKSISLYIFRMLFLVSMIAIVLGIIISYCAIYESNKVISNVLGLYIMPFNYKFLLIFAYIIFITVLLIALTVKRTKMLDNEFYNKFI